MSLSDNAHRLTEAHMALQDGRYAKVPALLDQLEQAIRGELHNGNAGGGGTALPVSVEALDLMRSMEGEGRDYMAELCPSFRGDLKAMVRFWATESISGEDHAFYEHVTLDWIDLIEGMVAPKKPRRKMPVPCPSCGDTYHGEERSIALTANCWDKDEKMLHPSFWDVSCGACGASWYGEELKWLTAALKASQTEGVEA